MVVGQGQGRTGWTGPNGLGKRAFDLAGSSLCLVVLAIPMAVIAAIVRAADGAPILFSQARPGRDGALFNLHKFRTMRSVAEATSDQGRLTQTGRRLRQTSVDELPELVNVLKGEMSLVGPRPLLPQYLDRYSPRQRRRHEVRPGITGWAQVNGRNAITWETKFELDVWYVDHWSFGLDLKILWMTVVQVFKGDGVSAEGHATMPEFMGSTGEDA
jgi:lipopolysaccharide/colanic/teichoic acid biosynthesis glycosyltransferase